jgi:hypothetical protein
MDTAEEFVEQKILEEPGARYGELKRLLIRLFKVGFENEQGRVELKAQISGNLVEDYNLKYTWISAKIQQMEGEMWLTDIL